MKNTKNYSIALDNFDMKWLHGLPWSLYLDM